VNRIATVCGVLIVLGLAAAAFLLGGARGAADWGRLRAVVLESDDWGFAGFVPTGDSWDGLDRAALSPGRFPPVYWGSTLEDSSDVAALAALLAAAVGRDGLPAVLQANYVMASLAWRDGAWRAYAWPSVPPAYSRPGLWAAVTAARARGVWRAEFHATWHYDPERRFAAGLETVTARAATGRGITLFPGSERARELGPWREPAVLAAELDASLAGFSEVFGRPAVSIIAPDYTWNGAVEELWESRGLTVIQAKREQRHPGLPGGSVGRVLKYLGRRLDAVLHPGRTYLERNCRFEPVQEAEPENARRRCAAEVKAAWERGEPAIIETHRVNFAHSDPTVPAAGRRALAGLLADVASRGPVFLTDDEVAQIARNGVSRTLRRALIVVRNASGSRRIVTVPTELLSAAGGGADSSPLLVTLPGHAVGLVFAQDGGWRIRSLSFPEVEYDSSS